jgi:hypothetical protein
VETDGASQKAVNDHIYNVSWGIVAEEGAFLCECSSSSCAAEVPMTPSKYVRLRDRGELVYAPGHGDAIPLAVSAKQLLT